MTPKQELEKIAQIAEDPESALFEHIEETESKFEEVDDRLEHLKEIDDDLEDLDERLKEEAKKNLVLNLEMAKEELADVSEKIEEQTKLMVENNKDKSKHLQICQYLETIKDLLKKEDKEDYSEIIKAINKASDRIKDPKETKIDLNPVLDQLKSFKKVIKDDRVKVELLDKQIDRIVNAVSFTGGRGSSGTFNKLGNQINPATEEKQDAIITAIGGISGGSGYEVVGIKDSSDTRIDPATETTLANVDSTLSSMDLTVNDINTALGEVQASPTANTVLDRLKAIKTSVDSATPAGTNLIGKVGIDQTTDGTTNKVAATQSTHDNLNGNANIQVANTDVSTSNPVPVKSMPPDTDVTTNTNAVRKYYTSAGAATDGIVWSPAAGKRWHITSLYFQVSADATVTFEDDKAAGDDPVLKGEFKAGSGLSLTFDKNYPMASGEDAADLLVTTSAGNIYITIVGFEV